MLFFSVFKVLHAFKTSDTWKYQWHSSWFYWIVLLIPQLFFTGHYFNDLHYIMQVKSCFLLMPTKGLSISYYKALYVCMSVFTNSHGPKVTYLNHKNNHTSSKSFQCQEVYAPGNLTYLTPSSPNPILSIMRGTHGPIRRHITRPRTCHLVNMQLW